MRGDIGVTPSSGWVAACIRWITRAPVAHAFLSVDDRSDWMIEGRPEGAGYGHSKTYRQVEWLTALSAGLTGAQRDEIVAWATAHRGAPYSWLDDAAIGCGDLFHGWVPGWLKKRARSDATLMCSQLVVEAYRAAGVDLFPHIAGGVVSPGDLWRLNRDRTQATA
ncbi:MAG: hypothetical protein ACTHMS_23645 [Jatrophihabitans sp.]|uniref:hypothetical protein n=1 Tax=Jatrophihabitans sp. TaxID=1932789 RepID=UPI003F7CDF07